MNTDELIAALSADGAPRITPEGRMWRALPGASLLALGALLLFWHTRPDLAQALGSFAVYKTAVPLVLSRSRTDQPSGRSTNSAWQRLTDRLGMRTRASSARPAP